MSLKAFHTFFITTALLITGGFGYWALETFSRTHQGGMLVLGLLSLAGAIGLGLYLVWFIRKAKTLPS